jgi:hypothetical protein
LEGAAFQTEKYREAVKERPTMKNKHEIRSFLGLCAYYRQFISSFANIANHSRKRRKPSRGFQK